MNKRLTDNDRFLLNHSKMHDPRYFAMLNNAVAVTDTQYEGGQTAQALAYYDYLLNLDLPECPIKLALPDNMVAAVQISIANMISTNESMEKLISGGLDNADLNNLIRDIDQINAQHGKCYLASGWVSSEGGHLAVLKCRPLENGQYAVSIINHGAGMSRHRQLSESGTKEKRCYQSDEYTIDFHSEKGQQFLKRIIELNDKSMITRDPDEKLKPYNADDLYGLLALYGHNRSSPDKIEEKSVTPQRSGTCTVTNVHAAARDSLVESGADFAQRKRYHFVIKLRSLIDAFYRYRHGEIEFDIMQWALREFSVRVNKHYQDILSEEELIYCGELHSDIAKQLAHDKKQAIRERCAVAAFPERDGAISSDSFIDKFAPLQDDFSAPKNPQAHSRARERTEFFEKLTAADINLDELATILKKLEELKNADNYLDCAFKLFTLLPNCSDVETIIWTRIQSRDVESIIGKLYLVCTELSTKQNEYSANDKREKSYAVMVKAYDIIAELAPKIENLKLGEQFTFGMDDVCEGKMGFRSPVVFYMLKQSMQNFKRRAKQKQRVMTNDPNERNKSYDSSVTYVMRNVLDERARSIIARDKARSEGKSYGSYTDQELFDYLMQNMLLTANDGKTVLPVLLRILISVSATIHNLGTQETKYHYDNVDNISYFTKRTHYQRELARANKTSKSNLGDDLITIRKELFVLNHIPKIESSPAIVHQDFSENTIFHPRESLAKFREELKDTDY